MESLIEWRDYLISLSDKAIINVGTTKLTIGGLITLILMLFLMVIVGNIFRRVLEKKILPKTGFDASVRVAIAAISRYAFLAFGAVVVLQMAGIDMTAFSVLAGTVGIGIGLGLQGIANNFISGIIILFERPVKVGDRIQVGDVFGDVVAINARSTTVVTNDNINILIPNASILNENVINWSYFDRKVRFKIPVGVAYGSDARKVECILLDVARSVPDILQDPAPAVCLTGFGESSIDFELRVWSTSLMDRSAQLKSKVYFGVLDAFEKHGIDIPFPQRDIHIKTSGVPNPVN